VLLRDVPPDVELGQVGDRKDPCGLPLANAAIVEIAQLGTLTLRFPWAELVAEGEDARSLVIFGVASPGRALSAFVAAA
jgi:hypothetical protein